MRHLPILALLFALVARAAAANLVVTNTTDTANGDTSSPAALVAAPGSDGISLREALMACNNAAGPHSIGFTAALAGQTIALTGNLRVTGDGISIIGALGADGRPAIVIDASNPAVAIAFDVVASNFSLRQIQLIGIRQVYGIKIHAPTSGLLANLTIDGNEFAAGGANINNNALSIGPDEGATGARISGVSITRNLFQHFTGDGDGVLVAANGAGGCVVEDLSIEENRFEDSAFPIEITSGGNGIHHQNVVQRTTIARNSFVGNSLAIILAGGEATSGGSTSANQITGTSITDNVLTDNTVAISLNGGGAGSSANEIRGVQILRNTITSSGRGVGIMLSHGSGSAGAPASADVIGDTVISENTLSNNLNGISLTAGSTSAAGCQILSTQISGNTFTGQQGSAIVIDGGTGAANGNRVSDTTVTQNTLLDNSSGVTVSAGSDTAIGNQILNTIITNNVIAGTQVGGAVALLNTVPAGRDNLITAVTIANDTIVDFQPAGFPAVGGGAAGSGNTISGVKIFNTIFWHNAGGDAGGVVQPADVANCLTTDPRYAGQNGNLAADPKFVDPTNRDYRLQPGSPAIDAGTSDSAPTIDLEGRPRYDDPATPNTGLGAMKFYDIGAYEFAPLFTAGHLVNLSVRAPLVSATEVMIVGTVLGGSGTGGTKPLLIRASGPSLAPFGVSDPLADPVLAVYAGTTLAAHNDNWGGDSGLVAAFTQTGAFLFSPANSKDAALVFTADTTTPSGAPTVQVGGNGGTGSTLAEIYDSTPAARLTVTTPRLVNLSLRKNVGSGLTLGFVIGGAAPLKVLVRAVGPKLAVFGVSDFISDPKLELYDSTSTGIVQNDNWDASLAPIFTSVGAFALDAGSKDAALYTVLNPGAYTVQVTTADGGDGEALVEVYAVP